MTDSPRILPRAEWPESLREKYADQGEDFYLIGGMTINGEETIVPCYNPDGPDSALEMAARFWEMLADA